MYQNIVCSYLYLAIKEQKTRRNTSEKQTKRMPKMLIEFFMKNHRLIQPMSLLLKDLFSREFENVAVSWDNASAVPAWLKGTYFKNGPARFSLWMKNSTTFFLFQARFWRKLEVRQHGGWLGKDLQVQRRCKWGEFRVLSSKLCQPAHFQAQ